MEENIYKTMVEKAIEARERAYTPYSKFKVGACLLTSSGDFYLGSNIENAAYTPSNCAERTAFFKAVSEGIYDFKAIAIVGGSEKDGIKDYCPPCGVCRQVMAEFCDKNEFEIILAKSENDYKVYKLSEILPLSFTKDDMEK